MKLKGSFFSAERRKKRAIILVLQFKDISLWSELSSPPHFMIQGGGVYPECDRRKDRKRTEIFVSNIGFFKAAYRAAPGSPGSAKYPPCDNPWVNSAMNLCSSLVTADIYLR